MLIINSDSIMECIDYFMAYKDAKVLSLKTTNETYFLVCSPDCKKDYDFLNHKEPMVFGDLSCQKSNSFLHLKNIYTNNVLLDEVFLNPNSISEITML